MRPEIIGILAVLFLFFIPYSALSFGDSSINETYKVKVSSYDLNENYLYNKLNEGTGIHLDILKPGADEDINISVDHHQVVYHNDKTFAGGWTNSDNNGTNGGIHVNTTTQDVYVRIKDFNTTNIQGWTISDGNFIIPRDGNYLVNASFSFQSQGQNKVYDLSLYKNGGELMNCETETRVGTVGDTQNASYQCIVSGKSGDKFTLWARCRSSPASVFIIRLMNLTFWGISD